MKELSIHPWSHSVTGEWSEDSGLLNLRDDDPATLSEELWPAGIGVQQTAVIELMAHGNPRKAAQLVRSLVEQHPDLKDTIRSQYAGLEEYLFDLPLDRLPSKPDEYPKNIKISYIQ